MIIYRNQRNFSREDYWGLSESNKKRLRADRKRIADNLRSVRNDNNWVIKTGGDYELRNFLHKKALKKSKDKSKDISKFYRGSDINYGMNKIKNSFGKLIKRRIA